MAGKISKKSVKVARARIKEPGSLKGVGWKKPMSIATEKYEQVTEAIMAVLPTKPIKFARLAKFVDKQLPNFEGSVAWYTLAVARELEAQGKLIRHAEPVLNSKARKQRSKAASDLPAENNVTIASSRAKGIA